MVPVLVLLALLAGPLLGGAAPEPGPRPVDGLSRFKSAQGGLTVDVARAGERVVVGRETSYTIVVANRGDEPEPVTVRVSVPPGMAAVAADAGGVVADGYVAWPVTVDPGGVATLHLTGAYPDRSPTRVALTACVLAPDGDQPVACDTDVAEVDRSGWATWWWLLPFAALAGSVAGIVLFRRRRRPQRT